MKRCNSRTWDNRKKEFIPCDREAVWIHPVLSEPICSSHKEMFDGLKHLENQWERIDQ